MASTLDPRPSTLAESALPIPLSLYIHIPWCVRKCPYCDFNSHALRGPVDETAYVDALLEDLDQEIARQQPGEVGSIFIGGGTPSLFSATSIGRLLDGLAGRLVLADAIEVTLEANPGTAEADHFAGYRAAGVNRLSIGVQSLDDAKLAGLGRIHRAAEARRACELARAAGFDNLNLDLMYGLPRQSLDEALDDLRGLFALAPEHLSWYQLTLEPNTLFHRRPPPLPHDDELADIADAGQQLLAEQGYRQYEVSAYARPDRHCRHNLNYWQFGDYLGVGAGAHGKRTTPAGEVWRRSKLRQPAAYLDAAARGGLSTERRLGTDELPIEFMLNALRLVDGVDAALFPQRTGLPLAAIGERLAAARARGLLRDAPGRLQPSAEGLRFLNDLLLMFEPA
jgi:oxygen-independent coproporphyrinogen-3 oxidase